MTEEKYRKKFLFPIKTFYESIGFDFSKEDFTIANDEFHLGFEQNFKKLALQPYAQDTIARFQKLESHKAYYLQQFKVDLKSK